MTVEVLYFPGCPNHALTVERVRGVLAQERIVATIAEVPVSDTLAASQLGFLGSPSVRVNGLDVEPAARGVRDYGMMCRTYVVDGRREGLPSREMIRVAILAVESGVEGGGASQRPAE